jgi:dihydrofolate reductase
MSESSQPQLVAIAAIDENRLIGVNNQLPWHLPADLQHFKALTTGHPILMGRKTFESIGRPLPNRLNIIMTRETQLTVPGCEVANSLEAALAIAKKQPSQEIFVIGGAEIYQQLMPYTQRIYLTVVHHAFTGDTFFPAIDMDAWREIGNERHAADANNPYAYSFVTLEKIR